MFFSRTITSGSFLLERDPSICLTEFQNVFSCSWYLKSFFSIKEKKKGLKNCSGFSQEYHNEKSLELSWHQTPAHWCVTTVFKPHWALVLHQRFPLSHLPLFFFFSPEKIHESLGSGIAAGWIKVLLLPSNWLKSSQFSWISLTEGIIQPRSQSHAKWNWWVRFSNFVLEKCSLQSPQTCFICHPFPLSACVYQWEGREQAALPFSLRFICCTIYRINLIMEPSQKGVRKALGSSIFENFYEIVNLCYIWLAKKTLRQRFFFFFRPSRQSTVECKHKDLCNFTRQPSKLAPSVLFNPPESLPPLISFL